ncbi:unnamed protein product [Echinostoma caproni]|uniref:Calcium-binding protein n=1 Tax=Echinostoma caproni TaxID=27848 RepID=A0A183AEA5_9TREM|nr:unnamed protein product [Echinostoma caproni]
MVFLSPQSSISLQHFRSTLDLNGDEEITLDEYKIALGIPFDLPPLAKLINPDYAKKMELLSLFAQADKNRDGEISKDEFRKIIQESNIPEDALQLPITWTRLFHELDRDHSGELSADELLLIFDQAGMPILREAVTGWIEQYDQNKDGKLNYNEFMTFVGRQAECAFP